MRFVPAALQAHLDSGVTTICRLLKITLSDGVSIIGISTHDQPITYQNVTYSASAGFDSTTIATDASYKVDNQEGYALLSSTLSGITVPLVKRGGLEGATWELLLINYNDLSMGHIILDAGDVGDVKLLNDQVYIPELVSYSMRLRQTIGGVDSRTCRAIFGNQKPGQLYCGVDANAMWVSGVVSAVSSEEPKRVFSGDVAQEVPGRLQWLTGDNASDNIYQIEVVSDLSTGLLESLPFVINVGDTYQVRPDCDKTLTTCRDTYNNMIEFKGEPLIPVGEGSQVPGANIS